MNHKATGRTDLLGKQRTALSYVIEAIIPFTDANLKLTFIPSAFFRELGETTDNDSERLRRAYYRAKKSGIVRYIDGHFAIDPNYLEKLRRELPEALPGGQSMLVIYDIPEKFEYKRRELRTLLRQLGFEQIQKSVWQTKSNHFRPVLALIGKLKLAPYVQVFVGTTEFDHYVLL